MSYSCSFSGECEEVYRGEGYYATLEQCQEECQGAPAKDLLYQVYSFQDPKEWLLLAPSDQRELLQRYYGMNLIGVEDAEVQPIVRALAYQDWLTTSRYGYIPPSFDVLDRLILELFTTADVKYPLIWPEVRASFLDIITGTWEGLRQFGYPPVPNRDDYLIEEIIRHLDHRFHLLGDRYHFMNNEAKWLRDLKFDLKREFFRVLTTLYQLFGPIIPLEEEQWE